MLDLIFLTYTSVLPFFLAFSANRHIREGRGGKYGSCLLLTFFVKTIKILIKNINTPDRRKNMYINSAFSVTHKIPLASTLVQQNPLNHHLSYPKGCVC